MTMTTPEIAAALTERVEALTAEYGAGVLDGPRERRGRLVWTWTAPTVRAYIAVRASASPVRATVTVTPRSGRRPGRPMLTPEQRASRDAARRVATTSLRIAYSLLAQVDAAAERDGVSRSAWVASVLARAVSS